MPKNRMVRTEIWTDDKFVSLTPLARLLFIGMWNFACDNGHLDDSALQLKMRVLPADNCDAADLLDELLERGMVAREGDYLKVVNLPAKQPLDLRFLVFCDHCDSDPACHYSREDKKGSRGPHASRTRAPREDTSSARRSGDGDVDGDVDGDGEAAPKPPSRPRGELELNPRRQRSHALPQDWRPTPKHQEYAKAQHVDVDREAFRFRNHAQANDRRQVDWNAAFSNWLTRAEPARAQSRSAATPEGW